MALVSNKTLIGITGSIGSGKSTALSIFGELGAVTISSDAIARTFTEPNSPVKSELISIFGPSIELEDGTINRTKIAELAFSNESKLKSLNELLHPLVRKSFLQFFQSQKEGSIVAWEVPLLFETDAHTICDFTVTVYLPKDQNWERVKQRGGMEKSDFERRTSSQMDIEKKKSLSDFVVTNDTDREGLKEQIVIIYKEIQKRIQK
ncbi:dephospho-CoA kinase [Leptospira levettii]|uniref:dephospho-CoA kinase n=1 Tax=Leptospira levettii TaxID=2023178 RepID=UPI000C2A8825|nr:dephospho-CoA kinase [Leptospira levettii]MCW7472657.1 dephospho-CoA kinase [Leptospira levettii]PJZ37378.1 dephospho-CoA kinase [Leptospira levettii]PJZ88120.1 dephospho-CoA kinase [Leptospira levettii]PKA00506.1 dephospho-CoA kinase [Leptospira levettii]